MGFGTNKTGPATRSVREETEKQRATSVGASRELDRITR